MDVIFGLDLGNGGWYHNEGSLIDTGGFCLLACKCVSVSVAACRSQLCRSMSGALGSQLSLSLFCV